MKANSIKLFGVAFGLLAGLCSTNALARNGCDDQRDGVIIAEQRVMFWCEEDLSVPYIAKRCMEEWEKLEQRQRELRQCEEARDSQRP